jgi:hypothetical protein
MRKHGLQRHSSMLRIIAAAVLLFLLGVTAIPLAQAQRLAGSDRPTTVPADYVVTPFGYFHPSCVRAVADGETVLADGRLQHTDGTVDATAPACGYPHYTARGEAATGGDSKPDPLTIIHSWIEDGATTTTTSYGKLTANWVVPSAPTTYDGQTVYLFPGLVDYNTDATIIQPVLGWNAFFGEVWSIASWNCCPSGTTLYSSPVQVSTGDTIHGTIKSMCAAGVESCSLWKITSEDMTTHKSTTLKKAPSEGQTFNWAQSGALEVYEIVQCSDYPPENATTFSKVAMYDYNFKKISNPGWSITDYYQGLTPQCNYGGQVTPNSVTLDY